ncbi:MAG: hypothetical protein LC777_04985 [Actinobacteria bacterium]|nr:hypothetical protein [Actinomycetota bacterium]
MTDSQLEHEAITQSIIAALADPQQTWITLPPVADHVPPALRAALDAFDAGQRPAAYAAMQWLKTEAIDAYAISRTRLLIAEHRIAGFYSLASAQVALRQSQRQSLGVTQNIVNVPAALVTWIAKDAQSGIDGVDLVLHATGTARRAAALQAATVLVVDAFDDETDRMWRGRFGFKSSSDKRRLWLPLDPTG